MARRRVFRTRVICPGVRDDLGPTAKQRALVGKIVTLERKAPSGVSLILDGAAVGDLNEPIATKVASALDCGQVFTATVEKAFPTYNEKFRPNGAQLDISVEYLLEKGQPAIETEKLWRCGPATETAQISRSFFTTVAGVTFEGRQRIVARCSVGERLVLVRDPDNRFDNGAIKVMLLNGEQLGFIPEHVSRGGDSSGLASRMDRGEKYECNISDLTGGGGKTLGVNIEITDADEFEARPWKSLVGAGDWSRFASRSVGRHCAQMTFSPESLWKR
jgi:hypothetical protein